MIFLANFASLAIPFVRPRPSRWLPAPYVPSRRQRCSKCFARKIRRRILWWPIYYPASRATRITWRICSLPSRTTARMRASAARTVGKERSTSYRAPHSQSPSSGGDGRDDSPANQFIHESIQETGIHKLRWGTGSASVVTKSSPKPLNISPKSWGLYWSSASDKVRLPNITVKPNRSAANAGRWPYSITFHTYKKVASLAVATFRPAFRVARLKAERTLSFDSANSANGTLSAELAFRPSRSLRIVVTIFLCFPFRPWGTSACTIVLKWRGGVLLWVRSIYSSR